MRSLPAYAYTAKKGLVRLARARRNFYLFLSTIYVQTISHSTVRGLLSKDFQLLLSSLTKGIGATDEILKGVSLIKKFIRESKSSSIEDIYTNLSIDQTRLFKGVKAGYGPPPPYESIYLREGSLMGRSTLEVLDVFKKAGVILTDHWREPADYIGVELDFMRLLCDKEAGAWDDNDPNKALRYMRMEDEFLKLHIIRWIPHFCDRMFTEARLDFYKGIAKLTKSFLIHEHTKMINYISVSEDCATSSKPSFDNL